MTEAVPIFEPDSQETSPVHREKELLDLQKENFEEHEQWHVKLQEVVSAIKKKSGALKEVTAAMRQKNDDDGSLEAQNIHLLLIVLGGAMQGPYGAGQISALQEMGYTDRHLDGRDVFLGISTGAPTCAFGMAGKKQALLGTSYYYTVCTTPSFINYLRLHPIVDVGFIEKILREGPMKLDVGAVLKNPAQLYVQARNENKQVPEFINAKNPGVDMIDAIHASMAIPMVYDQKIMIDHTAYTDGSFEDPLPITRAIEQFKPTHVLILPNIPFNRIPVEDPSKIKKMLLEAIPENSSLGFIRKVLEHRQMLRHALDAIAERHDVKIGIAWPPEMGLYPLVQDPKKIRDAIRASAKEMFVLFGENDRSLKLYEEEYGQ